MRVPAVIGAASSLIAVTAAQSSNVTCQNGAHIIVARASLEQPGFGILQPVKDQILVQIPDSDAVAVVYPAAIATPVIYTVSEPEGVGNMTQLVKQYGDACPGHLMILMGYSQGAQVTADVLLGSDYPNSNGIFPVTAGLEQKYIDNVAAVVMMGDPSNVAGSPVLAGNSTRSGFFPRGNIDAWQSTGLINRTVSYCDAEDTYCDKGLSLAVHVGYIAEYISNATSFAVSKYNTMAANRQAASPTSSGSPSSTSSGSPSSASSGSPSTTTSGAATTPSGNAASDNSVITRSWAFLGLLQCALVIALGC